MRSIRRARLVLEGRRSARSFACSAFATSRSALLIARCTRTLAPPGAAALSPGEEPRGLGPDEPGRCSRAGEEKRSPTPVLHAVPGTGENGRKGHAMPEQSSAHHDPGFARRVKDPQTASTETRG